MSNKVIAFLHNAADALPSENRTHMLLKSFYLSRSSHQITGPAAAAFALRTTTPDEAAACRRCCTKWQEKQFALRLSAGQNRCGRARRLVQLHESRDNGTMSASHRILAKKYLKTVSTIATSTCALCLTPRHTVIRHQDSATATKKRTHAPAPPAALPDQNRAIDLDTVQLVRKKKKSSDKNAGLILPARTPAAAIEATTPAAAVRHTTTVVLATPATKQQPKPVFSRPQPLSLAASAKTPKKSAKKTPHQKSVKMSASEKRAADAKQRNSMLLLANVLKMKDSAQDKRVTGLEQLLRKQ